MGHSTPYEEPACYTLAVEYLFHAGPALDPLPPLSIEPFSARDPRNDFELPWIMRALVDSPEIRDLFPGELNDLKEGIGHWRPMTKALRDMKRRVRCELLKVEERLMEVTCIARAYGREAE